MPQRLATAARALTGSGVELCFEKTLDMPFLAYYGCSKLLKARAVFYWGIHTRFTVSVGIDLSLTKTRRTRSADCICMDKRARLWEIVYYLDTCIVYLAVCEIPTEYPTHARTVVPRPFFPSPAKNGLGTRLIRAARRGADTIRFSTVAMATSMSKCKNTQVL